jgi:hypothetical protein
MLLETLLRQSLFACGDKRNKQIYGRVFMTDITKNICDVHTNFGKATNSH